MLPTPEGPPTQAPGPSQLHPQMPSHTRTLASSGCRALPSPLKTLLLSTAVHPFTNAPSSSLSAELLLNLQNPTQMSPTHGSWPHLQLLRFCPLYDHHIDSYESSAYRCVCLPRPVAPESVIISASQDPDTQCSHSLVESQRGSFFVTMFCLLQFLSASLPTCVHICSPPPPRQNPLAFSHTTDHVKLRSSLNSQLKKEVNQFHKPYARDWSHLGFVVV